MLNLLLMSNITKNKTLSNKYADECIKIRRKHIITQKDFARMLNITRPYLVMLERKKVNFPYRTFCMAKLIDNEINRLIEEGKIATHSSSTSSILCASS